MHAHHSHRTIVSEKTPVARETPYERARGALSTVALMLFGLSVFLITLWLQFAPLPPQPYFSGPYPLPPDSGPIPQPHITSFAFLGVVIPSDQPSDLVLNDADLSRLVAATTAVAAVDAIDLQSDVFGETPHDTDGGALDEGTGDRLDGSISTARRWIFEIAPVAGLDEYKQMLAQLGLELAAVFPDGRIVYVPVIRESGKLRTAEASSEQRYFTTWNSGDLARMDAQICEKAGLDVNGARFLHLFPLGLERTLEQNERQFAGRSPEQIQRTWFLVAQIGGNVKVTVTRQTGTPIR